MLRSLWSLSFLCAVSLSWAQIKVDVVCDKADWLYALGDTVHFSYRVTKDGHLLKSKVSVTYQIGPEKMASVLSGELGSSEGKLKGTTMNKAGFLRCVVHAIVDGKRYKGLATAAFEPEKIEPTVPFPQDFERFWKEAITNARKIELDPILEELPEKSTDKTKVYMVSFQNERKNSRIYGILTVPRKDGKFPAILEVPGAGIRAHHGNYEFVDDDIITLQIGIHGIPVNLDDRVYNNLANGSLLDYPFINLDSKRHYYYRRVYLGCVKAVDFIFSLPEFDQENIAVSGGSQGGALSIVTAALEPRIKYLRCHYPAICDLTGYLHSRAGGWPHLLIEHNAKRNNTDQKLETISYYDVVNFARILHTPGFYSWGFNDEVCPPTSMYAAYNSIQAPKELFLVKETGHVTTSVQVHARNSWLRKVLKTDRFK